MFSRLVKCVMGHGQALYVPSGALKRIILCSSRPCCGGVLDEPSGK